MDLQPHRTEAGHRYSSSSSAIDLSRTPAGLTGQPPSSSPSGPTNERYARKRSSWGQVEPGQDPLHLDTRVPAMPAHVVASPTGLSPSSGQPLVARSDSVDDPFWPGPPSRDNMAEAHRVASYGSGSSIASTAGPSRARLGASHSGQSELSLISRDTETLDEQHDDDEAGLTQNASAISGHRSWRRASRDDAERSVGETPSARRKSALKYGASPLSGTSNTLLNVSRTMKRISQRVVNLGNHAVEDHIRLEDEPEEKEREKETDSDIEVEAVLVSPETPVSAPVPLISPLRGRTLGFLGPSSRMRLAMYRFLMHPYVTCYRSPFML
jgi:hypothetical protein